MNNSRNAYYPVLLYTLLLVLVWLASWIASVVQGLSGAGTAVTSIASGEGVRWALLSVQETIAAVPWGMALFLLLMAGLLSGSGIMHTLAGLLMHGRTSRNELRSLLFSAAALLLYLAILFMFTVSPWHTLLGVTGELHSSPLAHGWPLALFAGVLPVSLVYGFMYGNYRAFSDVAAAAGELVSRYVPALLAMVPAAGIVPCMQFSGIDALLGLEEGGTALLRGVLYVLPFAYVAIIQASGRK